MCPEEWGALCLQPLHVAAPLREIAPQNSSHWVIVSVIMPYGETEFQGGSTRSAFARAVSAVAGTSLANVYLLVVDANDYRVVVDAKIVSVTREGNAALRARLGNDNAALLHRFNAALAAQSLRPANSVSVSSSDDDLGGVSGSSLSVASWRQGGTGGGGEVRQVVVVAFCLLAIFLSPFRLAGCT